MGNGVTGVNHCAPKDVEEESYSKREDVDPQLLNMEDCTAKEMGLRIQLTYAMSKAVMVNVFHL